MPRHSAPRRAAPYQTNQTRQDAPFFCPTPYESSPSPPLSFLSPPSFRPLSALCSPSPRPVSARV
eukprot:11162312-Lingulodinium_polyedra.AAC.1